MATKENTAKNVAELEEYFARRDTRMAPAWMPNVGDVLHGEVIGLRMGSSDYGNYPIIVYRNLADNSTVAVHAFHTVLRDRYKELNTDIGSVQFVSYMGKKATNKTKDSDDPTLYHLYDVENAGEQITAKEEDFTF